MIRFTILLIFYSSLAIGQVGILFPKDFLLEGDWDTNIPLSSFQSIDYSSLWLQTENQFVLGVIGAEHQRINIKLLHAIKDKSNPDLYHVAGKSMVHGNVCDFEGSIMLVKLMKIKVESGKTFREQGVLVGNYNFKENANQPHTGEFTGQVFTKWYISSEDKIHYNDFDKGTYKFMNNAFVGKWKRYASEDERLCHWADYHVPGANEDFDIGKTDFVPNEKYDAKGWKNYSDAWVHKNEMAKNEELKAWWK